MKEKKRARQAMDRRKGLRRRAEETRRARSSNKKANTLDLRRLVHELEIHQVELKIQNEERRNAQIQLAESRDRYTELYEFAPLAYVTLDRDGRVLESNQMATKMLGVERRDLMRASFTKFVTPESQDDWYLHRQAVLSSETTQVCEIRTRSADGTLRCIQVDSFAAGGRKDWCCRTALVDITERKRAEEERQQLLAREQAARKKMEAATQAKNRFLAIVSHELRTPLTPILGWVAVLHNKTAKDVGVASALDCIERNARMEAKLVEDLLDVSGSLAGKMRMNFMPVELPEIVTRAVETVRAIAEKKQIRIQMQLDKNARMASGDRGRLQQVIWNLLTNAVKFTSSSGQIRVQLLRIGSSIQVVVSDTGEGIPANFLPFVFDPFSQADNTHTRSQGGLGLGLAIARHIVETHGGTVRVRSTDAHDLYNKSSVQDRSR
jgi:PAS domain S-box-containing protein